MHHARLLRGQRAEGLGLIPEIRPAALVPPLHRHERLSQPPERRRRVPEREFPRRVAGAHHGAVATAVGERGGEGGRDGGAGEVGTLPADAVVEVLREGVVDDAD